MKGLTFLQILSVIILAFIAFAGFNALAKPNYDISQIWQGQKCNSDTKCDPWESTATCPQDCPRISTDVYLDWLVLDPNSPETVNQTQVKDLFNTPAPGYSTCSGGFSSCSECEDYKGFVNATGCNECESCDVNSGECDSCFSCQSAISEFRDKLNYTECQDAIDCSECQVVTPEQLAQNPTLVTTCNKCETVSTCYNRTNENAFAAYSSCKTCDRFDSETGKYEACDSCSNVPGAPTSNGCYTCNTASGGRTPAAACERKIEPELCSTLKQAIANWENGPIDLTEDNGLITSWTNFTGFIDALRNTLAKCTSEPLYKDLQEGGQQQICNFISKPFTRISANPQTPIDSAEAFWAYNISSSAIRGATFETKAVTFNNCGGIEIPAEDDYLVYGGFGFPSSTMSKGFRYKIVVGNVNPKGLVYPPQTILIFTLPAQSGTLLRKNAILNDPVPCDDWTNTPGAIKLCHSGDSYVSWSGPGVRVNVPITRYRIKEEKDSNGVYHETSLISVENFPEGTLVKNEETPPGNVYNDLIVTNGDSCNYNLFVCAQPPLTDYPEDPILNLHAKIFNTPITGPNQTIDIGSVRLLMFNKFVQNIGTANRDAGHVGNAILFGLMDFETSLIGDQEVIKYFSGLNLFNKEYTDDKYFRGETDIKNVYFYRTLSWALVELKPGYNRTALLTQIPQDYRLVAYEKPASGYFNGNIEVTLSLFAKLDGKNVILTPVVIFKKV